MMLNNELIVDLFAGGGGASTGIKMALGRDVDIAVNHDPEAISVHTANHPGAQHFCSDVFEIDPLVATAGRPVGLLWASPDCKHFSKAKGGKPVDKRIRSLAWVVIKWAKLVRPRVIILENVEEFQTWGPLGDDNLPCPQRKGQTFSLWKTQLRKLGYSIEHQELKACDYGTPTTRKRLFLIARCDGLPIIWPSPTHAKPGLDGTVPGGLLAWRTAAECIDFTLPCPSIFERKKPLADATCRRIAKGIVRYVLENPKPFIVSITHRGGERIEPADEPLRTITAANRGEKAVVSATLVPFLVQYHSAKHDADHRTADIEAPLPTQTTENRFGFVEAKIIGPVLVNTANSKTTGRAPNTWSMEDPLRTATSTCGFALVSAFLAKHYTGVVGHELNQPVGTVTSIDHHSLVTANLIHMGHGEGKNGDRRYSHGIKAIDQPLNTITASGVPSAMVTSHLVKLRNNQYGQHVKQPLPTLTAGGGHVGEIRAFLVKYYGTAIGSDLNEPAHTVTSKARMGLVTVTIAGEEYVIADIGLRMLAPAELYKCQGFPDSYIFEHGANGEGVTKTAQVRMVGNSVCPPMARQLVECNYRELQAEMAPERINVR